MTVVELGLYALLLAVAALAVWRRPVVALYLFVVGLALHNAVMAALYAAGVRGSTLTAITAWKEILLAVALARVGLGRLARAPAAVPASASPTGSRVAFARARRRLRAHPAVGARRPGRAPRGRARASGTTSFRSPRTSSGARSSCAATICGGSRWTLLGVAGARRRARASSTSTRCRSAGGGRTASSTTSTATWATTTTARARGSSRIGTVVRPAGELHLQRRRRQAVSAPARLDVPQPARERLPVRRRAARHRGRDAPARAVSLLGARHRRRPAVDVLALVARRARSGPRRARRGAPTPARARCRRRRDRRCDRLGARLPEDRPDRELDEGRPRATSSELGERAGPRSLQRDERERAVAALALDRA